MHNKMVANWKIYLVIGILIIGFIYALPNFFGEDPSIQVITKSRSLEYAQDEINTILQQLKITPKKIEIQTDKQFLIKFNDTYDQLATHQHLKTNESDAYNIALNLSPAMPGWLSVIGASPLKLGLDLRGGVRFLLDVDLDSSIKQFIAAEYKELRTQLKKEKLSYIRLSKDLDKWSIVLPNKAAVTAIETFLKEHKPHFDLTTTVKDNKHIMYIAINNRFISALNKEVLEKTAHTLRNRVNELGVAESIVQSQGSNYIAVELPGIQDTVRAKQILGKTATIEFRLLHLDAMKQELNPANLPHDAQLLFDANGRPVVLERDVILTGESIIGAVSQIDNETGQPVIAVRLGGAGLSKFSKMTANNIGRPLAVLYKESKLETVTIGGVEKKIPHVTQTVISVATINSALGSAFQITGFSMNKARDLSLLLRSGSLPTTISIVEEKVIGPNLGKDNIKKGVMSAAIGVSLVIVIMAAYYRVFGLIANIALIANLLMLLSLMSLIGATLTLPGIAGIVLTLGMAVDASVLIFERIREEKRKALPPFACLQRGFSHAFTTIVDANLTTLIVAVILYAIGSGAVKGFAVTLSLGILTSMFTSVTVTKVIIDLLLVRNKQSIKLNIGA